MGAGACRSTVCGGLLVLLYDDVQLAGDFLRNIGGKYAVVRVKGASAVKGIKNGVQGRTRLVGFMLDSGNVKVDFVAIGPPDGGWRDIGKRDVPGVNYGVEGVP